MLKKKSTNLTIIPHISEEPGHLTGFGRMCLFGKGKMPEKSNMEEIIALLLTSFSINRPPIEH